MHSYGARTSLNSVRSTGLDTRAALCTKAYECYTTQDHLGPTVPNNLKNIVRTKIVHTSGTFFRKSRFPTSYIQKKTQNPNIIFKISIYNTKYTKPHKITLKNGLGFSINFEQIKCFSFILYKKSIIRILYILYNLICLYIQ